RPDATLMVVFLSDADDCSERASHPAASQRVICRGGPADRDGDGVPDAFNAAPCEAGAAACFQAECGDLDADACYAARCTVDRATRDSCAWQRDALTPVAEYADFLADLRPSGDVEIAAIVAPPMRTEAGSVVDFVPGAPAPMCDPEAAEFDPGLSQTEACCPEGHCRGAVQPSCASSAGEAFAGLRYLALAEAFGERQATDCGSDPSACPSICTQDFTTPLRRIREGWSPVLGTFCFDARPVPDSVEVEIDGEPVAFDVEANDGCPGGAAVRLHAPPPHASEVTVRYQAR
ncbi:MAG: hypothetical protein R3F43_32690, partial [bacterium]